MIVQSIPAWPAGEKILPIMKRACENWVKPCIFALGFTKPFASPVLDKLKRVHSPGRLIH